jgi:hypothetical protein
VRNVKHRTKELHNAPQVHNRYRLGPISGLRAFDPSSAQEQNPPAMASQHDQGMPSNMMARMNKMMDQCGTMMEGHVMQHGMRHDNK